MSIKRMVAVWDHSKHSGPGLLLLLAIADYADENGLAWPGMTRLAQKARLDRSNVWRAINRLCDSGELLALNRERQRSNMYVVTPGLDRQQLDAAIVRARELGATSTRGAPDLRIPNEVLAVVGGCGVMSPNPDGSCGEQLEVVAESNQVVSQRNQGSVTAQPDPSLSVIDPSTIRQWRSILADSELQMHRTTFDDNLRNSQVVAVEDGTWTVALLRPLAVEWVDKRLRPIVERAAARHAPGVQLRFVAKEG